MVSGCDGPHYWSPDARRDRHRVRRPDRLRVRPPLRRAGLRRDRASRTTCAPLLRRRGLDPPHDRAAGRSDPTSSARSSSTSATPRASSACSPSTRRDRARRPHRRAALARLGGVATRTPTSRVNANGTLNLLEATRAHAPERRSSSARPTRSTATRPNLLPLVEHETRLELPATTATTTASTPRCRSTSTHSLFGVSKAAADLLVQEYGRYFDMPTVCFRGGCLTGPKHAGAELHGFLAYLMRCTVTGEPYTVFGYEGKQVRDNIHSADLVAAFEAFHAAPRAAAVYNLGGGRASNCSMLEAIAHVRGDRRPRARLDALRRRRGSATTAGGSATSTRSSATTPDWSLATSIEAILREIHDANVEHWASVVKLSVVIPAHNEEGSIEPTVEGSSSALEAPRDRLRDRRRRRRLHRRTRRRRAAPGRGRSARAPSLALPATASASRSGRARRVQGRRGRDRDGRRLRRPRRPRPLLPRCSRPATTARSARASCRGAR